VAKAGEGAALAGAPPGRGVAQRLMFSGTRHPFGGGRGHVAATALEAVASSRAWTASLGS